MQLRQVRRVTTSERENFVIFEVVGLKDACQGKVLVDIDDTLQKRSEFYCAMFTTFKM